MCNLLKCSKDHDDLSIGFHRPITDGPQQKINEKKSSESFRVGFFRKLFLDLLSN